MAKSRILVVDDEDGIRNIMKAALESEYEVIEAADGEHGLHQAKLYQPKLILMDIRMPKMDGLTALARLKAQEATRKIPVIISSVAGDAQALLDTQHAGAADHFIKPFEIEQLRALVRRYVA